IGSADCGKGQVLAYLRLPKSVEETFDNYNLHPSLMDSALQAAVGLIDDKQSHQARMPFALELLRVSAPCVRKMVAWVRYSTGNSAVDLMVNLDIDLCDES